MTFSLNPSQFLILYIVRKLDFYRIMFTGKNGNHFFYDVVVCFVTQTDAGSVIAWLFLTEHTDYTEYTYMYVFTEYT